MGEIDKLQVLVIANFPFQIAFRAEAPEDVWSSLEIIEGRKKCKFSSVDFWRICQMHVPQFLSICQSRLREQHILPLRKLPHGAPNRVCVARFKKTLEGEQCCPSFRKLDKSNFLPHWFKSLSSVQLSILLCSTPWGSIKYMILLSMHVTLRTYAIPESASRNERKRVGPDNLCLG